MCTSNVTYKFIYFSMYFDVLLPNLFENRNKIVFLYNQIV